MTVVTYARSLLTLSYFDYVSPISQEHTYSLCVENLLQCDVIIRAKYLRVLFCKLTRILNNLLNVSSQAVDVAIAPLLWLFEEREKTLEFWCKVARSLHQTRWSCSRGTWLCIFKSFGFYGKMTHACRRCCNYWLTRYSFW